MHVSVASLLVPKQQVADEHSLRTALSELDGGPYDNFMQSQFTMLVICMMKVGDI